MVQGYYTLQEAAKFLNMPLDELKQLAQKGKIRSFQDRGTLRFRTQDIQELARTRGGSSDDHELALGDASLPPAKPSSSAARRSPASPKTPAKQEGVPDVFDFDVDADKVDVGADLPVPGSGARSKPGSKGRKAPTPVPGSDSDVRLVADGSDVTFSVPKDSDIKIPDSDVKISPDPLKPKTGLNPPPPSSGAKRPSQLALGSGTKPKSKLGAPSSAAKQASPRPGNTPQPADSGVRLVPMDDDSDVKLHGSSDDVPLGLGPDAGTSDSNVRLEKPQLPPADSSEGMLLTEEINLDEEIQKQQELEKDKPPTKMKAKSELKLPTSSPFELSDSDLELPSELKAEAGPKTPRGAPAASDSSDFDLAATGGPEDGSSDFDLVPAKDGSIVLEDSGDLSLEAGAESEQVLDQEGAGELTGPTSGISLENPADQGISLEEGNDDASDFDLSLDVEATPKPQLSSPIDDSDSEFDLTPGKTPRPVKSADEPEDSSEFDLSLDADADAPAAQSESSEFEINLEGSGERATSESDGEFELTLDDSGNQAVVEEPQVKSKAKSKTKMKPASNEEQDIFDTDFEVPVLDDSNSDETIADSELESSDFDLALDDSELAQEEESGSQVVALDEEDSETVADDDGAVVDDVEVEEESSDFADLDADVEVDEDVEVEEEGETVTRTKTVIKEKLIPAAPWGVLPVIFMLPCVVIMLLVAIMGYEFVGSTVGNKPPGPLTVEIAKLLDQKFVLR